MTGIEKTIIKELKEVKDMLSVSDLVNEKEAAIILGVTANTMRIYASRGKLDGTYTLNALGKRMYFKSKLVRKAV